MANNLTLGIIDVRHEHSGDESDEDDDEVVEQSPCGRWEKRRLEVGEGFVINTGSKAFWYCVCEKSSVID